MQPAFVQSEQLLNQDQSLSPNRPVQASRFNDLDSRVAVKEPNGVSQLAFQLVSAIKSGDFKPSDLKHVAFAMNFQVVEGKDTAALVAKITDLNQQLTDMTRRAEIAEAALEAIGKESDAANAPQ
ncbi:MAG TPA: hypothetical protein VFO86_09025 [Terriglobia bacterium]|nr:hypothetical protein [Terriglobia bacterium]